MPIGCMALTLAPPVLPSGTQMREKAAAATMRVSCPKISRTSRRRHAMPSVPTWLRKCSHVWRWPRTCALSRCANASSHSPPAWRSELPATRQGRFLDVVAARLNRLLPARLSLAAFAYLLTLVENSAAGWALRGIRWRIHRCILDVAVGRRRDTPGSLGCHRCNVVPDRCGDRALGTGCGGLVRIARWRSERNRR